MCPICQQIAECEAGTHPRLIAETATAWAVMGQSQWFRGYSLLLCKIPARELFELDETTRCKYLQEMDRLSQVVWNVVSPRKLNYECLGNVAPHLHWHILPRHHDDLQPDSPVWTFWNQNDVTHFFDAERDGELLDQLRAEWKRLVRC